MGLDMYLYAKRFASGYDFVPEEKRELYNTITDVVGVKGTDRAPFAEVKVNVGYWRKVNSVHGWFVRELADGVDNCQPIYVPREKLVELRDLCTQAIATRPALVSSGVEATTVIEGEATDIMSAIKQEWDIQTHEAEFNDPNDTDPLRPTGGFFFGSTEKDEWYYEDLADTVRICDEALALGQEWDFEYCASW